MVVKDESAHYLTYPFIFKRTFTSSTEKCFPYSTPSNIASRSAFSLPIGDPSFYVGTWGEGLQVDIPAESGNQVSIEPVYVAHDFNGNCHLQPLVGIVGSGAPLVAFFNTHKLLDWEISMSQVGNVFERAELHFRLTDESNGQAYSTQSYLKVRPPSPL